MARNKKTSESLFQFMNLLIALLLKNGQLRTMQHYKATLNSYMRDPEATRTSPSKI